MKNSSENANSKPQGLSLCKLLVGHFKLHASMSFLKFTILYAFSNIFNLASNTKANMVDQNLSQESIASKITTELKFWRYF